MINKFNTELKGGLNKMGFTPTKPKYEGSGIAIWEALDKNGKLYFKVKVLNGTSINCFELKEKPAE